MSDYLPDPLAGERTAQLLNLLDCLIERVTDEVTIGDAEQLSDLTTALGNIVDCLR